MDVQPDCVLGHQLRLNKVLGDQSKEIDDALGRLSTDEDSVYSHRSAEANAVLDLQLKYEESVMDRQSKDKDSIFSQHFIELDAVLINLSKEVGYVLNGKYKADDIMENRSKGMASVSSKRFNKVTRVSGKKSKNAARLSRKRSRNATDFLHRKYKNNRTFVKSKNTDRTWLQSVLDMSATVRTASWSLRPLLKYFPIIKSVASSSLLFADVVTGMFSLIDIVTKIIGDNSMDSIVGAKALAKGTFDYVKPRIQKLTPRMEKLERMLGILEVEDPKKRKLLLDEFLEMVRLCRLDIEECMGNLKETEPEMEKCMQKPKVSAAISFLPEFFFGKAEGASDATLRRHLETYQFRCKCIYEDLEGVKCRLDSYVASLQDDVGQNSQNGADGQETNSHGHINVELLERSCIVSQLKIITA